MDSQERTGIISVVEAFTKCSVLLIAIMYGLGLMVSNQYLAALDVGIGDYGALHPKYVATGAWSLALLIVSALPVLSVSGVISLIKRQNVDRGPLVITLIISCIGLIFIAVPLQQVIFGLLRVAPSPLTHKEGYILAFVTCVAVLPMQPWFMKRTKRFSMRFWMSLSISILMIYYATTLLGTRAYSMIPEANGGGKGISIDLILSKDGIGLWSQLGFPGTVTDLNRRVGPFSLLYQNDQDFVLRGIMTKDGNRLEKVVIVKRSLVDAILPN